MSKLDYTLGSDVDRPRLYVEIRSDGDHLGDMEWVDQGPRLTIYSRPGGDHAEPWIVDPEALAELLGAAAGRLRSLYGPEGPRPQQ